MSPPKTENEKEVAEGLRLVAAFRKIRNPDEREKILAAVEDVARRAESHKDL